MEQAPEDFSIDEARREVMERHARLIAERHGEAVEPLTAAHVFRPPPDMTPTQGIGMLAVLALFLLSPMAGGALRDAIGLRGFASVMLALATVAAVTMRGATSTMALRPVERGALLVVLAAAVVTGRELALELLPAIVHAAVARMMLASLGDDESIIEQSARMAHPLAPDFIRPYCRKLTVWWGLLFGISATVIAGLALAGERTAWEAWCGWLFWTGLGVFVVAEFFFRKAWFRYFGKGPFDQLLARVWPPERTARGRRSMAYMRLMHEELARMAESSR